MSVLDTMVIVEVLGDSKLVLIDGATVIDEGLRDFAISLSTTLHKRVL